MPSMCRRRALNDRFKDLEPTVDVNFWCTPYRTPSAHAGAALRKNEF